MNEQLRQNKEEIKKSLDKAVEEYMNDPFMSIREISKKYRLSLNTVSFEIKKRYGELYGKSIKEKTVRLNGTGEEKKIFLNNHFLYPSVSIANHVEQNARPTTASEQQLKLFQKKVLNDSSKRIVRKYSDKEKANYISMFDKYKQNKFDKGNVALTSRITGVPKTTISYWLKQPDSNTNLQGEKKLTDQTGETEPSNLILNVDLDIDMEIGEPSHRASIIERKLTSNKVPRLLEKILGEQEIPVFDHEMLETVEKNVQKEGVSGKKTNQSILEVSSNLGNAEEGSHHPLIVESRPTLEDLEKINRLLEKILGEQEIPVFDHEMLGIVEKNGQKEGISGKKTNQSILEVSSNLGNAEEGSHHPPIVESRPTLEDLEEINRLLEKILGEQEIPVFDHEMQSVVETNLQNEREIDGKSHMSQSFEKADSNSRDNKEKNCPSPIVESSSIFDLLNQLEDAKETELSFLEILNEQPAGKNSKQTKTTINKKDNESRIFTVQEIEDKQEHSLLNLTENNRDKCSSLTRKTYVPLLPKQALQNPVTVLHFNEPFTKVPEATNIIINGSTIQIAEEKGEDIAKKWHPDLSSLSQNISSAKSKAKEKTQINQNMDLPKTTNTKLYKSKKYREKR